MDSVSKEVDVVVIGGGLAGLTCARELKEKHHANVVVVEARDRVGGRTETVQIHGEHFDIGAQWVGETQDKVINLAKEFGVEIFDHHIKGKEILFFQNKKIPYQGLIPPIPSYIPFVPSISILLDLDRTMKKIDQLSEQVPLEAPWKAPKAKEWDRITAHAWFVQNCWTSGALNILERAVENVFAAQSFEISFLFFLFYIHSGGGIDRLVSIEGGAQGQRLVGGTQQLSTKLAEKIGLENIVLNAPVRMIQQKDDHVVVVSDKGSFIGKYVVVAIPPTLAGRIQYDPLLPPLRDRLMQRMPMGSVIKTIVFYEKSWWREKNLSGQLVNADENPDFPVSACFDDCDKDNKVSALMGFVIAEKSVEWMTKTKEERKQAIIQQYAKQFGCKEALDCIDYVEKNWALEEWSRGCYTGIMQTGTMTSCGHALREPIGRIHWAGTETAKKWAGYMDGAIESGERAAEEVALCLKRKE